MNAGVLRVSRTGAVATLTIDDPGARNAVSAELTQALVAACSELNTDLGTGCIILTGAGDVFCAGGNLKDMYRREKHFAGNAAEVRRSYINGVQSIARAFYELEVPTIAAVNGPAMGAGLDLALMCNIQIASGRAQFASSFIKLGLTSAASGAWFLTRAIGRSAAAELALTGDTIDAARALELGIVSRVVTPERLMEEANEIAARITRHPPHSIRLNTRLLREAARLDLAATLEMAASMQAVVQQTADQYEAVAAVMEKRAPKYLGR